MKFSILQQDFLPKLQAVARSCGVRAQLPVLGNILIQAQNNTLKISGTNLEIGVVKEIKAEVEEDGEITVPAKTFVEVISNLAGEKIECSATSDQLQINTPTFSSQINGISASEFPSIPLSGKEAIKLNAKTLTSSLPQISFAAAVDEGRPILTGILTEIKDKKLQFVATDGYRLAHKVVVIDEDYSFKVLIPRRTFEEVLRLITEDGAEDVTISLSDNQNQIIFSFGQTQLSSRLIEGQFPVWEKIIPSEFKARLIVDKAEFLKSVKLASVFARTDANVIKMQNTQGKLILLSEAKELGSQKKELEVENDGEEVPIAFNAKFLQDIFLAINTEKALIELSGTLSAAVIKPVGEEGLEYIVMPVNLS